MKEIIKSLLISNKGSLSSKRFCGILGWLICIVVFIYCTIELTQAPNMIDTLLWCCVGLLGVDSVADIWKSKS